MYRNPNSYECKDCMHRKRLKYNFRVGFGYEESWACVALINLRDGQIENEQERKSDAFVVEVADHGFCELWQGRNGNECNKSENE